jgi:hypothetical protein
VVFRSDGWVFWNDALGRRALKLGVHAMERELLNLLLGGG